MVVATEGIHMITGLQNGPLISVPCRMFSSFHRGQILSLKIGGMIMICPSKKNVFHIHQSRPKWFLCYLVYFTTLSQLLKLYIVK
jgi:hypothetical protein